MPKIPIDVISWYVSDVTEAQPSELKTSRELAAKYKVIPLRIRCARGERVIIDRITDIRRAASTKAGGLGIRYTCMATMGERQREILVFKEDDSWFIEEDF